jgi:hypothetical protein
MAAVVSDALVAPQQEPISDHLSVIFSVIFWVVLIVSRIVY